MRLSGFAGVIAALLLPMIDARADASELDPQVGKTYEIIMTRESSRQGSDGSSASSQDKDAIIERVIDVRADGLELDYDLPKVTTLDERASNWQFPAHVYRPYQGPMQLLNRAELEARVEAWLKKAELARAACGRWGFTWTAFRIECDPQSVIDTLEAFDLSFPGIREGAIYRDAQALSPAPLTRKSAGPEGSTFTVELEIDPDAVRRARAQSDVVVAEITKKALTLDAALREHAKEAVSGTISVTFDTDSAGNVRRRTKVTKREIREPGGRLETETITETLERRLAKS